MKRARERLILLEERVKEINKKDKLSSFKLAIDGYAIMELFGISQGREVGKIKQNIESLILDGVVRNRKRDLIKYIKENKDSLLTSASEREK